MKTTDRCARSGQGARIIDGRTGHLVILATVNRACMGCGNVLPVTTNAFGLARWPEHGKSTGSWLDEV